MLRRAPGFPVAPTKTMPGLDLHAWSRHDRAGGGANIGTGIAVEIPPGHAGLVLPRSGLAAQHGIAVVNSPGLIDSGYRGEVRVLLLNTDRARAFEVNPGDRIAQLVVTPIAAAEPVGRRSGQNSRQMTTAAGASPIRGGAASAPAAAEPRANDREGSTPKRCLPGSLVGGRLECVVERCKLRLPAVAAGKSELDQAIGEPGILGQRGPCR